MAKRRSARRKVNVSKSRKGSSGRTVQEVLRQIEERAPLECSEDWDNVGLLAGSVRARVSSAVVSVDLTADVIDLAIRKKANLIINHHPCIFPKSRGLSRVTDSGGPTAALVHRAVENHISVAAYHTNFDQCALEVVRAVSHGLGVEPKGRLLDKPRGAMTKLVVFVPFEHGDFVRNAICQAGAGQIGNYDLCSFSSEGTGTFRGGPSTRPLIGKPGHLERVDEYRLETVFPTGLERQVVEAMLKAHPYEEVAYDLYPLKQAPGSEGIVRGLGYGLWGEFRSAKPFSEVLKSVKHLFNIDGFWLTNPPPKKVRRLAFVAGKGASFVGAALAAGCDLFITGEAGYHDALNGARRGMAVMELGHRQSERFFLTTMEGWLAQIGVRATLVQNATQRIWA